MEQLKVIGTEDDALVLATESGERFTLPVDDALRFELRRTRRDRAPEPRVSKASPREIQMHIRAGLSAEEVASLLGAKVEDIARYEGPVLAEREHIVGQALAVPVLMGGELEQDALPTFGAAVRAKLTEAGATGERWTSWKEPTGWIVKLEFSANEVAHDARWSFDPRRTILSPLNADAVQLSRQGSLPDGLIPRLRALETVPPRDDTRFDSGAFGPRRPPEADMASPELPAPVAPAVQQAAIKRATEPVVTSAETADLLEALRRRRGQREPFPGIDEVPSTPTSKSPVALFDALEPGYDDTIVEAPAGEQPATPARHEPAPSSLRLDPAPTTEGAGRRKGRAAMPSWDEIVFGARTDD
ncbi:septation protein SepH [Microbacterium sp. BWT-B31]|uniref:septation protein SepH n=1 Tax=Microbacterium sp. BWT-B31 TaxID=3232072 RepID=UPI003527DA1D